MSTPADALFELPGSRHVVVRDPEPIAWPDSLAYLRDVDPPIHHWQCTATGCYFGCDNERAAGLHEADPTFGRYA